jgi:hypothetical protein
VLIAKIMSIVFNRSVLLAGSVVTRSSGGDDPVVWEGDAQHSLEI